MNSSIFKYQVPFPGQEIELPKGARAISAQVQGNNLCLWAEVDPRASTVKRLVRVIGTGWPDSLDERMSHVSTYQLDDLMWHVYVENER
tara:strand:+ start:141 stop:407 length:267 start_codon:yes stop_codon:yes gene_type:complete